MESISNLNKTLIEELLSEIQISNSKYEEAEQRYNALGKWLNRDESSVARFNPKIYAQGSFLLGTATKPINKEDEHDVDIVCELNISKQSISQSALKKMIGDEIKAYAESHGMDNKPTEGKRCWTLVYADGTRFHIDILPAVPDRRLLVEFKNDTRVKPHRLETAIAITDQQHPSFESITDDWLVSNPKGYHDWFKEQMAEQYKAKYETMIESFHGEVEDLPTYKVRTTLQYAVQLLKYHRDVMFEKDFDNKPISVIITTLVAHAYENESNLVDALVTIGSGMRKFVFRDKGEWKVINPVNPNENFAEKWNEDSDGSKLVDNFFKWLNQVEEIFSTDMFRKETEPFYESYKQSFGTGVVAAALEKASSKKQIPQKNPAPNINVSPKKPWTSIL